MSEKFNIGSREFQVGKIDPFKQFHIVRRMGPILGELAPMIQEFAKVAKAGVESVSEDARLEIISKFISPIMNGLAKLSDEDANRVLFGLLSAVEMKQSAGNWARVATDTALMFSDLELPVLLNAAGRSFVFNLSGFFPALPQK